MVIALGIVRIPIYARIVRGSVLSVKALQYVEAANALAVPPWRLMLRHILPNCMAPLIVTSTLSVGTSIIVEASLSFLGLGTQPPTPSWGWDLKANLLLLEINPWITIFPGVAIFSRSWRSTCLAMGCATPLTHDSRNNRKDRNL